MAKKRKLRSRMAGPRGSRMGEAPSAPPERYGCYLAAMQLCDMAEQAKLAHAKVNEGDLWAAESFTGGVHAAAHGASVMTVLKPFSSDLSKIARRAEKLSNGIKQARLSSKALDARAKEALRGEVRNLRDDIEQAMQAGHETCGS